MEARFLPHRGVVGGAPGRLPELLEQLKLEVEQLSHDANVYKLQRDDFERKRAPPSMPKRELTHTALSPATASGGLFHPEHNI